MGLDLAGPARQDFRTGAEVRLSPVSPVSRPFEDTWPAMPGSPMSIHAATLLFRLFIQSSLRVLDAEPGV